jgi:hypothetical protein
MRVQVDRPGYILDRLWSVGEVFNWPAGHALGSWVHEVGGSDPTPVRVMPKPGCVRCNGADPLMHGYHFNESNGRWDDPCPKHPPTPVVEPEGEDI